MDILKFGTLKVFRCLLVYLRIQPDLWVDLDLSWFVEMNLLLLLLWLDCLIGFVLSYKQGRMNNLGWFKSISICFLTETNSEQKICDHNILQQLKQWSCAEITLEIKLAELLINNNCKRVVTVELLVYNDSILKNAQEGCIARHGMWQGVFYQVCNKQIF